MLLIPAAEFQQFQDILETTTGQCPVLHEFTGVLQPYVQLCEQYQFTLATAESATLDLLYKISTITFLLLSKGFCLPADLAEEVLEREGEEIGGGGAGGGEVGEDDVTEEFDEEDLDDPLTDEQKARVRKMAYPGCAEMFKLF